MLVILERPPHTVQLRKRGVLMRSKSLREIHGMEEGDAEVILAPIGPVLSMAPHVKTFSVCL